MLLKLEDLVADSDGQMDAVWKFVGVRPPKRRRVAPGAGPQSPAAEEMGTAKKRKRLAVWCETFVTP